MKVVGKQRNSRMCFICGMDNPIGLHAQFYNMEDGSVISPVTFREEHQSFPGRVHGGLIATMLDELGLRALWSVKGEEDFGVTMSMEVKFRKPVPYNEQVFGRGSLIKETSMFVIVKAEILDRSGKILSEGEVKYIKLAPEQIKKNIVVKEEMCYLIEDDIKEIIIG